MAQSGLEHEGLWCGSCLGCVLLFMYFIEILVAFLQAYIYAIISLFIGLATVEHH